MSAVAVLYEGISRDCIFIKIFTVVVVVPKVYYSRIYMSIFTLAVVVSRYQQWP